MEVFSVTHSDTSTVGSITLGHQSDDLFFSGLIKHGMDTHDNSVWCADMLKSITSHPVFSVHTSFQ
jgi:hypothetical protein